MVKVRMDTNVEVEYFKQGEFLIMCLGYWPEALS